MNDLEYQADVTRDLFLLCTFSLIYSAYYIKTEFSLEHSGSNWCVSGA